MKLQTATFKATIGKETIDCHLNYVTQMFSLSFENSASVLSVDGRSAEFVEELAKLVYKIEVELGIKAKEAGSLQKVDLPYFLEKTGGAIYIDLAYIVTPLCFEQWLEDAGLCL